MFDLPSPRRCNAPSRKVPRTSGAFPRPALQTDELSGPDFYVVLQCPTLQNRSRSSQAAREVNESDFLLLDSAFSGSRVLTFSRDINVTWNLSFCCVREFENSSSKLSLYITMSFNIELHPRRSKIHDNSTIRGFLSRPLTLQRIVHVC